MVTLFISGSGTDVGKTRVAAALGRVAARRGLSVRFVKPVQTGVAPGEPTDADTAARLAGLAPAFAHTLLCFRAPLAPVAAAAAQAEVFAMADLALQFEQVPPSDVRIVEGAGGLAVPLGEDGLDWAQLTEPLGVDAVILVVPDQLGAINQARLAYHYFSSFNQHGLPGGIFLNARTPPPPAVASSTRAGLASSGVPLWGELAADSLAPTLHAPLTELLGL
jgi:dethiobiotin synthase